MTLSPDDPSLRDAIISAVADGFDRQTRFLADFTRIPSRRGQEDAALDFMAMHGIKKRWVWDR